VGKAQQVEMEINQERNMYNGRTLLSLKCNRWHLSVKGRKANPFCISNETWHPFTACVAGEKRARGELFELRGLRGKRAGGR